MIDLMDAASQIIKNNPESAVALYDVLLFMAQPNAVLSPEYDGAKEMLYAVTLDSQKHRKLYEKARAA